MSTNSHTAARENLAPTMDQVCDDHELVVIIALEEIPYLLRSPANARRPLAATKQLSKRKGRSRKMVLNAMHDLVGLLG